MKILIAADGSVYTKRMLAFVAAHDEWLGSQHTLTVLHCVPPIPHPAAASVGLRNLRACVRVFPLRTRRARGTATRPSHWRQQGAASIGTGYFGDARQPRLIARSGTGDQQIELPRQRSLDVRAKPLPEAIRRGSAKHDEQCAD